MLVSVQFQNEFVSAVHRQVESRGDCRIDYDTLQKVLETAGNFLACLPAMDERHIVANWYLHSVEAMGGS